jgi:hypothetical protein
MSCLRMVARRGVVEEATLQNWEKTQSKSAPPSPFFSSSQIFTLSFRLLLPYCLGFRIYSHPVLIQLSSILIHCNICSHFKFWIYCKFRVPLGGFFFFLFSFFTPIFTYEKIQGKIKHGFTCSHFKLHGDLSVLKSLRFRV